MPRFLNKKNRVFLNNKIDKLTNILKQIVEDPQQIEQKSIEAKKFRNQYYDFLNGVDELFRRIDREL